MKITLSNIGKWYNEKPIIRDFNFTFEQGGKYAIIGGNGSGKSTLLKIISGALSPNQGSILYNKNDNLVPQDKLYKEIGFAAPYIDLILDYSLMELVRFHFSIKQLLESQQINDVPSILGLTEHQDKPIKQFSSGMMQRVKLGLSILSNSSLLLLDEPTTNLDTNGEKWYLDLIDRFCQNKTIVVCSNNRTAEYAFCNEEVFLENYK